MFFNLHSKMTLLHFQLIIINYYCHDTGRSFEPIFMKFTWLMRVHTWVNSIFFGNNQSNRTTDIWENVPPKLVFWLSFIRYGGFSKKFQNRTWYPISHRKGYVYFCRPTPHSLKNGHAPQKIIFHCYFGKYSCFFFF